MPQFIVAVTPQGEGTWENHAGRHRRTCPAVAFRTEPAFFPVSSLRLFFLGNKYTNISEDRCNDGLKYIYGVAIGAG
jgi:hypothetical protein